MPTTSPEPSLHPGGATPARLLHVFPTFVAAGLQQRAAQLMAAFGDRFRHAILSMDGDVGALGLLPDALDVEVLDLPRRAGALAGVRAARAVLTGVRPDLLLTYNWGSFDTVLAARSLGLAAHVHHEDGFNADEARRQKTRRVLARRIGLRGVFRTVVPSHNLVRIGREVWRLSAERLQLIPNGVHMDRFCPEGPTGETREAGETGETGETRETDPPGRGRAATRRRLGIPDDALLVGSVGHLRPVKNYARLIRACALLPAERFATPGVHLLFVGDGEQRAALEGLARTLPPPGGRVHFAGHQDDLTPFYRALDVFCLSSDSEQQPISLLEAMATGVAVAATDVGDIGACLPEEARAQLVRLDAADPVRELAAALERLLGDDGLRRRLAELGRRVVKERYSFSKMLQDYSELYEAALSAR